MWLTQHTGDRAQPTDEQREYVAVSRQASVRRQRILIGALTTGLVIATLLAIYAAIQQTIAVRETHAARTQLRDTQALILASTAQRLTGSRLDESLLLALEANKLDPSSPQARSAMVGALAASGDSGLEAVLGPGSEAENVNAVAFSPVGQMLAAGGASGTVRLYDIARRRSLTIADVGGVDGLAFAPDRPVLAVASNDGRVRLFAVADDKLRQVANEPAGGSGVDVNSVAFAARGSLLATGSGDGRVRLFTVADDKLRQVAIKRADDSGLGVNSVAFAAGGSLLAVGSGDGRVRLFAVADHHLRQVDSKLADYATEESPASSMPKAAASRAWRSQRAGRCSR